MSSMKIVKEFIAALEAKNLHEAASHMADNKTVEGAVVMQMDKYPSGHTRNDNGMMGNA